MTPTMKHWDRPARAGERCVAGLVERIMLLSKISERIMLERIMLLSILKSLTTKVHWKSLVAQKFHPPPLCRSSRVRQSRNGLDYFSKLPENINVMSLHSCFFEFRLGFLRFHYFWWTSLTGNDRMREIPCKSMNRLWSKWLIFPFQKLENHQT